MFRPTPHESLGAVDWADAMVGRPGRGVGSHHSAPRQNIPNTFHMQIPPSQRLVLSAAATPLALQGGPVHIVTHIGFGNIVFN